MFCSNCGTACPDGANHCHSCGARLVGAQPVAAQPAEQQPIVQQPVVHKEKSAAAKAALELFENISKAIKPWWPFVIVGIAGIAFIFSILSLFGVLQVPINASAYGISQTTYMPLSTVNTQTALIQISYIIYGVFSLLICGIGVLYFLKNMNIPVYDDVIVKITDKIYPGMGPGVVMGAFGSLATLIVWIFSLCFVQSSNGISVDAGVNWLFWVVNLFYTAVAVMDLLMVNPKKK